MDPLKKQAWIDALRSGDYKQGSNSLRYRGDDGSEKLHRSPATTEELHMNTIVSMNDHGESFDEIAKFIDKNF